MGPNIKEIPPLTYTLLFVAVAEDVLAHNDDKDTENKYTD